MPSQTCIRCSHWETLSANEQSPVGLCRRFALAPSFDAWPLTGSEDACEYWVAAAHIGLTVETLRTERRAVVRERCDCPANLVLPGGERSGRLSNISRNGACLRLSNPPRKGMTALLKWKSHEVLCDVAWSKADSCGVTFDAPIPGTVILETTGQSSEESEFVADPSNIPLGVKRVRTQLRA